ncbi:putative outer membrane starch-binding protein [Arcticibacter tournemirensis]|uniref:RagB/SusD family nutrient uptake outer membrane protein n=1 Tax=Arcticibacter tournemirensis TaxID=699437 RepID=A0A5M9HAS9_9SPHI|nr:RagB/SusD family nutrient uptake outer membrane protein [Arcticibacter tournemirensis]KAA8484056.1 RagB/SusD family nutrient uptake outer membrane protein [Arcticibacter tournemirensis]TQM51789.1 putative outer membrane starch-binding protein [Arcticibacter tournemirensis]
MRSILINGSTFALGITLMFNTGCKDYLDQIPDNRITIEEVFQKKEPSEQYLANVYSYIPDESNQWTDNPWWGNSDEADITWTKYNIYRLNILNYSPGATIFDKWGTYYNGIRAATYFINHIDGNTEILSLAGQVLIDQYKAEARFLRAYYYFLLMRQYGPVVLVGDKDMAPDASAASLQLPRSTFDECVEYVSSELDQAARVLPLVPSIAGVPNQTQLGRATVGMALAVKSRLLLYAASPLYNGNTEVTNFKNSEGVPLISQTSDVNKWKKAVDAAKAVIDLGIYNLYKEPGNNAQKSYEDIFLVAGNSEQIFVRPNNNQVELEVHSTPRSAGGWNGVGATQEQVDAYFMNDGKPINESSLYSETGFTTVNGVQVSNMYLNREPRFYASILYNNTVWRLGNMNAAGTINFFRSGPNGSAGHATDWTRTGYLVRKNVSPETNSGANSANRAFKRPQVHFRLGEIYLNYVEALNEYDPTNPDIVRYLNYIRERAGIPQYGPGTNQLPVPANQVEMRQRIRAERRVELAFEGHRWFDIRRWKIAPQVMGNMHGMDISKDGNDFYKRVVASTHLFRSPASYWFPISQYEIDRATLVIQNPGW